MTHLKRLVAPKSWPIKRKGIVFTTRQNPRTQAKYSIPLSIVLRDMLKLVQKAREALRVLKERKVLVNGKIRTEPKFPVTIFDVVEIPTIGKHYNVTLTKLGRLNLQEIQKPKHRLGRVENKTKITGGKIQLNLFDGTNAIVGKDEYKTGDVVKLSVPENKVIGKLSPEKGANAFVIGGAHIGESARIKALELEKNPKEVLLEGESGEFRTRLANIFVIE